MVLVAVLPCVCFKVTANVSSMAPLHDILSTDRVDFRLQRCPVSSLHSHRQRQWCALPVVTQDVNCCTCRLPSQLL